MRHAIVVVIGIAFLTMSPAAAQDSSSDQMRDLIQELNDIIARGERDRLADPWYLQDLRAIVSRYENPFGAVSYSEDFQRDGTPPAPWQILQGEMRVDWRSGLRSVVRSQAQTSQSSSGSSSSNSSAGGDLGQQLLGSILRGVVQSQGNNSSSSGSNNSGSSTYSDGSTPAIAIAQTEITNSFRLEAEISIAAMSANEHPSVELGVYQLQGSVYPGYRLWFDAEDKRITLLRIGSCGQSVVYSAAIPDTMIDGTAKTVIWSRLPDGTMKLTAAGEEVFSIVDRGFSDPWAGIFLRNASGDVSLRRISVATADASGSGRPASGSSASGGTTSGGSSWSNPN